MLLENTSLSNSHFLSTSFLLKDFVNDLFSLFPKQFGEQYC